MGEILLSAFLRLYGGFYKMKQLYDINAAASLLSISPWTVRHYIHIGRLNPVRIGRRVLLEEDELARLIASGRLQRAALDTPGAETHQCIIAQQTSIEGEMTHGSR